MNDRKKSSGDKSGDPGIGPCPTNIHRILNLNIEQSKHYEIDNLVGNKYIASFRSTCNKVGS